MATMAKICKGLALVLALGTFILSAQDSAITHAFTELDGPVGKIEFIIPFYEGIRLDSAQQTLREAGLARIQLAYPGVLSAPFIAWRDASQKEEKWIALYAESLSALPVALDIDAESPKFEVRLSSLSHCVMKRLESKGDWRALALALRSAWNVKAVRSPFAAVFKEVHFYVHQWIDDKALPALKINWSLDALKQRMRTEEATALQFVYGFDPGSVDLGGECFPSLETQKAVRSALEANPKLSHMAWLNLRTFKNEIPALKREVPLPDELRACLKQLPPGTSAGEGQWSFKASEMCLASEAWQRSRMKQFERLADLGFKVIQLDEFPIPEHWHVAPCCAQSHLHQANDTVSEWREIMKFIDRLAKRADERGVRLTCEEPSAALLPFVCGYIDRQFNDSVELYGAWKKSKGASTLPFFSATFGAVMTPYTDVDNAEPARKPPENWIMNRKQWPQ